METYTAKYVLINGEVKKGVYIKVRDGKFELVSNEQPPGQIHDFGNAIIVPGTINTHTHSMQSLIRGYGDDLPLLPWLRGTVYKYCEYMDERHAYWGALLSFAEMIKNGITTVIDFFYLNGFGNQSSRAVIKAARDLGIRLVLARTMMDWEDCPPSLQETPKIAKERFIELYDEWKDDPLVKVCPAPHSAYGASPEMIRTALELSEELNIPCHMHVSDSKGAMELTFQLRGKEYIRFLKDIGALNPRFVAVHCIWCGEEEIELLAEAGVKVSHNPVSNKFLGEPTSQIVEMLERGVIVGLGTDGAASNNCLSIFQEMKAAALGQKSFYQNPEAINADTVWRMGTEYGANISGFPVGKIEPNLGADFVVIDLNDLALFPEKQLKSHLVYTLPERSISYVYVAGKPILAHGRFTQIDPVEVKTNINELTKNW